MDPAEVLQPLVVDRSQQVLLGQPLDGERLLLHDAVPDEDPRLPRDQSLEGSAPEHGVGEGEVRGEEHTCPDEPAQERAVVPDHGVLQDVR